VQFIACAVFAVVSQHVRLSSSLSAAARRWDKGQLQQWSLFPRRAARQPLELGELLPAAAVHQLTISLSRSCLGQAG